MGVVQAALLTAVYWVFVNDPGWIEIGKTDWRAPFVLVACTIGGILVPGIALLLAVRRNATVRTRVLWALDMGGCAALLIVAGQYG